MALQLFEGILAAAAAAGVADSARIAVLRAGVAARSVGNRQPGRAPHKALLWLWGALADHAGSHRVGAELARFADKSAFGVLGETATQAGSLSDAFEHVTRYVRLVVQSVTVEIETNDPFYVLTYRLLGSTNPPSGGEAASMLWANANLALLSERAFGVRLRPMSAELACAEFDDAGGVIADIFGSDVTFGTADWRLVFDRSAVLAVSRPVASSALAYLDAYGADALNDMPALGDIRGLVAAEIRGRLAGRPPTLAEIAKALGLSTRSLQRSLATAGGSFEAELDEVRRACAQALLADGGWDLGEIAHKLGYSEHSAFTRAAIRWFGMPPSQMR